MKTKLTAGLLCLLALGCVNPKFPKDSHIENAIVKVVTPWGGYEMFIEQLDTGVAARNTTTPPPSRATPVRAKAVVVPTVIVPPTVEPQPP